MKWHKIVVPEAIWSCVNHIDTTNFRSDSGPRNWRRCNVRKQSLPLRHQIRLCQPVLCLNYIRRFSRRTKPTRLYLTVYARLMSCNISRISSISTFHSRNLPNNTIYCIRIWSRLQHTLDRVWYIDFLLDFEWHSPHDKCSHESNFTRNGTRVAHRVIVGSAYHLPLLKPELYFVLAPWMVRIHRSALPRN
jgi:hypothetical protein